MAKKKKTKAEKCEKIVDSIFKLLDKLAETAEGKK